MICEIRVCHLNPAKGTHKILTRQILANLTAILYNN
mgnify:CR=1 FL=1